MGERRRISFETSILHLYLFSLYEHGRTGIVNAPLTAGPQSSALQPYYTKTHRSSTSLDRSFPHPGVAPTSPS